jgi:hypothetical protein
LRLAVAETEVEDEDSVEVEVGVVLESTEDALALDSGPAAGPADGEDPASVVVLERDM